MTLSASRSIRCPRKCSRTLSCVTITLEDWPAYPRSGSGVERNERVTKRRGLRNERVTKRRGLIAIKETDFFRWYPQLPDCLNGIIYLVKWRNGNEGTHILDRGYMFGLTRRAFCEITFQRGAER